MQLSFAKQQRLNLEGLPITNWKPNRFLLEWKRFTTACNLWDKLQKSHSVFDVSEIADPIERNMWCEASVAFAKVHEPKSSAWMRYDRLQTEIDQPQPLTHILVVVPPGQGKPSPTTIWGIAICTISTPEHANLDWISVAPENRQKSLGKTLAYACLLVIARFSVPCLCVDTNLDPKSKAHAPSFWEKILGKPQLILPGYFTGSKKDRGAFWYAYPFTFFKKIETFTKITS